MEFKTLGNKRRMFTTESSIKYFYIPRHFRKRQVLLYAHSTMWWFVPRLIFYQKTWCWPMLAGLRTTGDENASSGLKLEQKYYFCAYLDEWPAILQNFRRLLDPTAVAGDVTGAFWYMSWSIKQMNRQTLNDAVHLHEFYLKHAISSVYQKTEMKLSTNGPGTIGIFDKLFIRCFKELQNSLRGCK